MHLQVKRPNSKAEFNATSVLSLPLNEVSAKVSTWPLITDDCIFKFLEATINDE